MSTSPVSTADARRIVLEAIREIAPDLEGADVAPDADLRVDLDLDSMDRVNLTVAMGERLGREIPERDASRLDTVAAWTAYVRDRVPAP